MAVIENSGLMKYKDKDGNTNIMYPITTMENVDGVEEALAGKAAASHVSDTNVHITGEYTEAEIQAIWDSAKVITLVTFTIIDTLELGYPTGSFTAEEGITLTEWLASSYNTSHIQAQYEDSQYGTVQLVGNDMDGIKEGSTFDWGL